MKKSLIILSLSLLFACSVPAQVKIQNWTMVIDTAGTTFAGDSVYVGYTDKQLEIMNDGAVNLYFAVRNDTASPKFYILKAGEKRYFEKVGDVGFIRLRAASSTCPYRVGRAW